MNQDLLTAYAAILAEAIEALGEVPSGHLYARMMGHMDLETYQAVITQLKRAGLVAESNHLLTWTEGAAMKKTMPAGEAKPLGQSEMKTPQGWRYWTTPGAWSADAYPSRDAARAAKREARTEKQGVARKAGATESNVEKTSEADEKVLDNATDGEVGLLQDAGPQAIPPSADSQQQEHPMTLTLKTLSKNGKQAYYTGSAQVLRFPLGAFPNKTAPQTIEVSGDVFVGPKEQKPKETKEERKARLAAQPRPTEAERIAKMEANLAKRKAKLEAANTL